MQQDYVMRSISSIQKFRYQKMNAYFKIKDNEN